MASSVTSIALFALMLSAAVTVVTERLCIHLKLFDQPNERKMHTAPIPRFGGVAFVLVPLIMAPFIPLQAPAGILFGAILVYIGGIYDDINPANSAIVKLAFQVPACLALAVWLPTDFLHLSFFLELTVRGLAALFALFLVNAANLMDNMNGLTSGLTMIWLGGIILISPIGKEFQELTLFCAVLIASILGFTFRNFPWGKIYMGDQGSQLLGYALASVSLLVVPHSFSGEAAPVVGKTLLVLFILSLIFIADVTTVVVIRIREKRPIWQGDQCHLSHQLRKRGLSPTLSAVILNMIQAAATVLALVVARKLG